MRKDEKNDKKRSFDISQNSNQTPEQEVVNSITHSSKKQKVNQSTNIKHQKKTFHFLTDQGNRLFPLLKLSNANTEKQEKSDLHKALNYLALFFVGEFECAAAMVLPNRQSKQIFITANKMNVLNKGKFGNSPRYKKLFLKLNYFRHFLNKKANSNNNEPRVIPELVEEEVLLIKTVIFDRIREDFKSGVNMYYTPHVNKVVGALFYYIFKKEEKIEEDDQSINKKSILQYLHENKKLDKESISKLANRLNKTLKEQSPSLEISIKLIAYALDYYRQLHFLKRFLSNSDEMKSVNNITLLFIGDEAKAPNVNSNDKKPINFAQHAELKLLSFALRHLSLEALGKLSKTPIGISKKSCRGCFVTLKMLNQVIRESRGAKQNSNDDEDEDSIIIDNEKDESGLIEVLHKEDSPITVAGTHDISFKKRLPAMFCEKAAEDTPVQFCRIKVNTSLKNRENLKQKELKKVCNINATIKEQINTIAKRHNWKKLIRFQQIKFKDDSSFQVLVKQLKFYTKRHVTKEEFSTLYQPLETKAPVRHNSSAESVDLVNIISSHPSSQSDEVKERLQNELKDKDEKIKELQEKNTFLNAKLLKADEKADKFEAENNKLKEENTSFKNENSALKVNYIKLEKENSALKSNNEKLKNEFESIRREFVKQKQSNKSNPQYSSDLSVFSSDRNKKNQTDDEGFSNNNNFSSNNK